MIKVSQRQRGNSLLSHLSSATWAYDSDITADYEINSSTSILFLSLKFHSCKPEYIFKRISRLKETRLRLVMVLLDSPNYGLSLRELFTSLPLTVIVCGSYEECSRYIRGFDVGTRRSYEVLRRKAPGVDNFLASFPRINKSDVAGIRRSHASMQEFLLGNDTDGIAGIGKIKKDGILKYLRMPFNKKHSL